VELLRDEDVQHVIDRMIVRRIANRSGVRRWPGVGDPAGREPAGTLIQLMADRAFEWSLTPVRSFSGSSSVTHQPGRRGSSTIWS